ncbi:MAG: MFS transporter [Candidatus Thorarchaeota archaeon]
MKRILLQTKSLLNRDGTLKQEVSIATLVSATGIGIFMGALDDSVVNISLPTIEKFFSINDLTVQWIFLIYNLIIIALMTVAGNLGDRFGAKYIFQIGMVLFTLGSFLCAISHTFDILIIARIFQAIGATGLFANGLAIITRFTTRENRGVAIGWNSLIVSIALVLGPILGGFLTQYFGWYSIFLINIPIGIIGLIWVQIAIPPTPPLDKKKEINENKKEFDVLGVILFPIALFLITGSLTVLGSISIPNHYLIALFLFIMGLFAFIILYFVERGTQNPNIDLSLFSNKRFAAGIFSAVLAFGVLQIIVFRLPFFLQDSRTVALTPDQAGLIMISITLIMAFSGPFAGRLSDKVDAYKLSTIGMIGIGVCLVIIGILVSISLSIPLIYFIISLIVLLAGFGLTVGFFITPNGNSVMSSSPKNKLSLAGGLLGLSRIVGFTLGVAFSTALLTLIENLQGQINNLPISNASIYVSSLEWMFFLSLPFVIIGVFISYFRGPEERGKFVFGD